MELSRYIHLNPWRVKEGVDPFKYPWSSLASYVGARALPSWLTVKEITSHFGAKAKKGYGDFVTEGIKSGIGTPWEDVRGQAVMGSEKFIEAILAVHVRGKGKKEDVRPRELAGIKPEASWQR